MKKNMIKSNLINKFINQEITMQEYIEALFNQLKNYD